MAEKPYNHTVRIRKEREGDNLIVYYEFSDTADISGRKEQLVVFTTISASTPVLDLELAIFKRVRELVDQQIAALERK